MGKVRQNLPGMRNTEYISVDLCLDNVRLTSAGICIFCIDLNCGSDPKSRQTIGIRSRNKFGLKVDGEHCIMVISSCGAGTR